MASTAQQLQANKTAWHRKLTAKGHAPAWRRVRGSGGFYFYIGTCQRCDGRVEVDDMGAETQNLGWGPGVRRCRRLR